MKKFSILTTALLSLFISGCSLTQPQTGMIGKSLELKKDRDYIASIGRTNELYILDGKTDELYKSCKLKGAYMSGALVISPDGSKAYVLQDNWQAIYGYDMNTCENFFKAELSHENVRAMSIFSYTLSKDGKKLYTISNPTEMLTDRYKVLDPVFKTFDTSAGLEAKAINSFKVPRQISIMATADDGTIYASGANLYKINPEKKEVSIAAKLRNWDKENYSSPDTLAMWPIGNVSNEFLLMYTAAKFPNSKMDMNEAEFVWGATRLDLTTGKIEQEDFAPIETIMFTGMTHPNDSNILYGVLTDLTKFDRKNQKVIKRVDLDHTYYCINFATDGSKIYIGGALNKIAIYDPETLKQIKTVVLPDGDFGTGTLQVFRAI